MDNPVHVHLNGLNSARGFLLTRSVLKSLHHQLGPNFVGLKMFAVIIAGRQV